MTIKPHVLPGDILAALDGVTARTFVPSLHKTAFKGTEGLWVNGCSYVSCGDTYMHCLSLYLPMIWCDCFILPDDMVCPDGSRIDYVIHSLMTAFIFPFETLFFMFI